MTCEYFSPCPLSIPLVTSVWKPPTKTPFASCFFCHDNHRHQVRPRVLLDLWRRLARHGLQTLSVLTLPCSFASASVGWLGITKREAGVKCRFEFCWDCGVSYTDILRLGNNMHGRECKHRPANTAMGRLLGEPVPHLRAEGEDRPRHHVRRGRVFEDFPHDDGLHRFGGARFGEMDHDMMPGDGLHIFGGGLMEARDWEEGLPVRHQGRHPYGAIEDEPSAGRG